MTGCAAPVLLWYVHMVQGRPARQPVPDCSHAPNRQAMGVPAPHIVMCSDGSGEPNPCTYTTPATHESVTHVYLPPTPLLPLCWAMCYLHYLHSVPHVHIFKFITHQDALHTFARRHFLAECWLPTRQC